MEPYNPEDELIDLLADQIADDERLIDGLGAGTYALEDVEKWQRQRSKDEALFLERCGELIERMKAEHFGRMMRRGARHTSRWAA